MDIEPTGHTPEELSAMHSKADHASFDAGEFCVLVCDSLRDVEDWCWGTEECHNFCDLNAGSMDNEEWNAYISCAADNPLCYQTIDECIGFALPRFSVHGSEFPAYSVYSAFGFVTNQANEFVWVESEVITGEFTLTWDEVLSESAATDVFYFADINNNRQCDPTDWAGQVDVSRPITEVRGYDARPNNNPNYTGCSYLQPE